MRALGEAAEKYFVELQAKSLANFEWHDTSIGNIGLWECSLNTIETVRAEPLARKLFFETFVHLEGCSRIQPFHRR